MATESTLRVTPLVVFIVGSLGVAGYFTGLQSPMNPDRDEAIAETENEPPQESGEVALAVSYSEISSLVQSKGKRSSLTDLKANDKLMEEITIKPEDKLAALALREKTRAFNGAPPTIPHPIEQMSSTACMSCHGSGKKSNTLRIPQMSHVFLANCTQCHVETSAIHQNPYVFRESSFVGLAAPKQGPRAFSNAPPQMPHPNFMRSNCLSCHGPNGAHGLRTTHAWRTNCQQCHLPKTSSNQTQLPPKANFLPGPAVIKAPGVDEGQK